MSGLICGALLAFHDTTVVASIDKHRDKRRCRLQIKGIFDLHRTPWLPKISCAASLWGHHWDAWCSRSFKGYLGSLREEMRYTFKNWRKFWKSEVESFREKCISLVLPATPLYGSGPLDCPFTVQLGNYEGQRYNYVIFAWHYFVPRKPKGSMKLSCMLVSYM